MKKTIALLCAVTLGVRASYGCDVCGCASGGQYFGLLPQASRSFAGVQYQYYHFTTAHPSLFENSTEERSKNFYNTVQAWGRYTVGKRLQVFAFVPYRYSMQRGDTATHRMQGLGDITLIADVVILNKPINHFTHQLLAGGGVKLPTGKHTGITEMDRQGLPNMQPGTGSLDFVLNGNYTGRRNSTGMYLDAAYSLTTPNGDNLKYGNKLAAGLAVFRAVEAGNVRLLPQAGGRYEFALQDNDNYPRRWLNEQSGGYMLFGTVGVQAYYRRVGARLLGSMPLSQHYSAGYLQAKQRIETSLFILF